VAVRDEPLPPLRQETVDETMEEVRGGGSRKKG
jgi:hypothetical protein